MGVELNVIEKGKIPRNIKKEVVNTLSECYRRFSSSASNMVEVQIVDMEITVRDFLREEKLRVGIASGGEGVLICSHDAWRGYPRIVVCSENLNRLGKLARTGAIRHGAAHSVLHGSLEYYIFRISGDCLHTAKIKGLDTSVLEQVLHYLSVAVKDFEASRFLIKHDYINCQFAYALERIRLSEEDRSAWKSAKANRQAKFLYQASLLKPVLFAHPLLALPRSRKISLEHQVQLGRRVEEIVEHLEDTERVRLLQVANLIAENSTEDTHTNVDFALHYAMSLA